MEGWRQVVYIDASGDVSLSNEAKWQFVKKCRDIPLETIVKFGLTGGSCAHGTPCACMPIYLSHYEYKNIYMYYVFVFVYALIHIHISLCSARGRETDDA